MKFLLLNISGVIIDIVDTVHYVRQNENGLTVNAFAENAQGYLGSDDNTVYAKAGSQFRPSYDDIFRVVPVESVPATVEPLKYKWDDETQTCVENDEGYAESNMTLTATANKNAADILYVAMMTGTDLGDDVPEEEEIAEEDAANE